MSNLNNSPVEPSDEVKLLLKRATTSRAESPFDYIIVGSGAGGGPLASRLALAGKHVLLLESGQDPAMGLSKSHPGADVGEVHGCPGYHAAATEEEGMSWQFSVRHYADTRQQTKDDKYNQKHPPDRRFLDPQLNGNPGKGGIFYPRSSALGGCTAHHAMIMTVPNDCDWNYIADLTGDQSWRASEMRGYFARLERCLYLGAYRRWLQKLLGPIYFIWQKAVLLFDPRAVLAEGGHGKDGWQPTSFIDPTLIDGIKSTDRGFVDVITKTALSVLHNDSGLLPLLKRALVRFRIIQHIDPNDLNTRRTSPEGIFLIPTGIEGGTTNDNESKIKVGRRAGVREFLLNTQAKHPDRLVIQTGMHVTRVIFGTEDHVPGSPPRAVGVEVAKGVYLYEASPLRVPPPSSHETYYVRGEVILSGGAFNTPQLLMLSGIGDKNQLKRHNIECRVDLPGVGRNLQDRYEVSVISELHEELETLKGVSFRPGDPDDPARLQWVKNGSGLYGTNGGTIAVLRRSSARKMNEPEPDTFTFGAPAAFRGYYWGWSKELLRRHPGATDDERKLWSWIILKAYTRNDAGTVSLRSSNPFDQPEICFDYFNEKAKLEATEIERLSEPFLRRRQALPEKLAERAAANNKILADSERDVEALVDAVRYVRQINAHNPSRFRSEIQPGVERPDGSEELKEWILTQAWGHHASCTCRIGSDPWQVDSSQLRDRFAVLDSHFSVHGALGLRVVDASVFPKIPGYFLLTPILMISEKAADTLLKDSIYPEAFENVEAAAIRQRRSKAHSVRSAPDPDVVAGGTPIPVGPTPDTSSSYGLEKLPADTVGLALSGGGIRSATFALGVLQAFAKRDRLRDVDFLSTVSGGGFTGSFLGRLFTRNITKATADPVGRVQDLLKDSRSGPLWWLRTQANYIFAMGRSDIPLNLAVFWRNIISVHLVVGALIFSVFGVLVWLSRMLPLPSAPTISAVPLSPWWWLPIFVVGIGVAPMTLGYWLVQKPGSYRSYPFFSLLAWLVLVVGGLLCFLLPRAPIFAASTLTVVLLSWLWQEAARWGTSTNDDLKIARKRYQQLKRQSQSYEAQTEDLFEKLKAVRQREGIIVRNRMTRALSELLVILGALIVWVVLDTVALVFAKNTYASSFATLMVVLAPVLPILKWMAMRIQVQISDGSMGKLSPMRITKYIGVPLALFLLCGVDMLTHRLFLFFPDMGIWFVIAALIFSAALGRAFDFLNFSSLNSSFAVRLARTFQGASNEERVYESSSNQSRDVQLAHPQDDLPFADYHPEQQGGPLHLINVCINETVDLASQREVRQRKGLPMCVTPHGVIVGSRHFAEWTPPDELPLWQNRRRWREGMDAEDAIPMNKRPRTALKALPISSDPNAFHVLKTRESESAEVEPLSLGNWIAISGAAFSTGIGRETSLPLSLLMGLANIRLGYWWDSGIKPEERPERYPPSLWRRIKRFPSKCFSMQSMLLAEWRARFRGPSEWFWYLSDGGHFEVTGAYELIRRRVPLIILSDAGRDADYVFGDVAQLARQVRMDFGAEIEWLDPSTQVDIPPWIREWVNWNELTFIGNLRRSGPHHAALARVTYAGKSETSWIILLKPCLSDSLPQDIVNYGNEKSAFPQDPTVDQVFDDIQWESYRALGQHITLKVLSGGTGSRRN